jgi:PAS domain S-box-containing protein
MIPNDAVSPRSEDWYQEVLDTAPDAMIIVGRDENIIFVNRQTEQLFGYGRAALVGQPLDTLVPERLRAGHGKHVARFFSNPGTRPMGSGIELFGRRVDGVEIPIEVSLSPVHTRAGFLVSAAIRDISERKHAQAAAKLTADRLASAVESVQDAFALFDASDRLVLCNSVYRGLLGDCLPGPIIGRSYTEVVDAWLEDLTFTDDDERARFRAERLAGRRNQKMTFDVRTRDGRSLRVMDRRTVEGGLVKTIWDLTDDVRLAEELQVARAAAEAASAAKSEFLSSMSHELRTPLNAILGFAQLLRRDRKEPLSERHRERAEQILKGGEHLLRLIDDILDLSRIEASGVSISIEPVGVRDVLAEVRSTLETMASRAGLTLAIGVLPMNLPAVAVDRTRFVQILMNFGSNAIKYNRPDGSVIFTASTPSAEHVRITVSDTGMGIAPDKQGKLFQPFQRAGQETGAIEGTGIGLVISKRLAEMMNGSVGFRSVAGEGSEFWVDMPVHSSLTKEPAPRSAEDGKRKGLQAESARLVLYVEDNPANVLFMKDMLSGFESIELATSPTAEMGIELARARRPAVVIMDINLPGMSGLDALHALRALPETSAIPVIALTAAASERDRIRGEQAGFYRYLTKPVKVDELEAALQKVLWPDAPPAPGA